MAVGEGKRPLRLGMVGIGVGGAQKLRVIDTMDTVELVAGADIDELTRDRFAERYPKAHVYGSADRLFEDRDVDAVWISSPNRFHAEHTISAAEHGKHVVVEKPMAISLAEAEDMVAAAEKSGVVLIAGHTRSYTAPVRAMRRIIQSGRLGPVRAIHVMSYSDWMLRPRSSDELDPTQGGGIPYRQGPHQIDTVRLLGGGLLQRVRASVGQWMPERPIPGYYSAFLEFENGTPATIIHNGYGYFHTAELVPWFQFKPGRSIEERVAVRRQLRTGQRDEVQDKQQLRIGGALERTVGEASDESGRTPWMPEDMGFLVVSCERGDMRHSKYGISIYDDNGLHDVPLPPEHLTSEGSSELDELYGAVMLNKPTFHDGRWGMATLEVCLGLMESSNTRSEVTLAHQVAMPDDYDADFEVDFP